MKIQSERKLSLDTRLVQPQVENKDYYNASSPPLYQTATFKMNSATDQGEYDYTRSGNPTRTLLEDQIADLEDGVSAYAYTSGMAAVSACCSIVYQNNGNHIVAPNDLYGGTSRLLSNIVQKQGINVSFVDVTNPQSVEDAIVQGQTKLLILESPTNPRFQVCDIQLLVDIAHKKDVYVMVDNSIYTFLYQTPLNLGADLSMISATKYISGHADVTGGTVAVKDKKLAEQLKFVQNAEGAGLAPFDCWLLLRGIKTMKLRMNQSIQSCKKIASFLKEQSIVKKINYPGDEENVGFQINQKQSKTGGALLSFETGDVEISKRIVENVKLFKCTVSFGSVTSTIGLPCLMSHASIPAHIRKERGLSEDLVRISVGIEDIDDLLFDLTQAFKVVLK